MAVSGPMHMDLMGRRDAGNRLEKVGKKRKEHTKPSPVKRTDRPVDKKILEDYLAARPTSEGMLRGFDPYIGTGLLTANVGGQEE